MLVVKFSASECKQDRRGEFLTTTTHYLRTFSSIVGARTAGYFGRGRKGFEVFYGAVPARAKLGAELLMYSVQD
jgi:hypothetical protein